MPMPQIQKWWQRSAANVSSIAVPNLQPPMSGYHCVIQLVIALSRGQTGRFRLLQ